MSHPLHIPSVNDDLRTQIKTWIMMMLGAPVVKVELTEVMVDEAIDSAIKRFTQWSPAVEEFCLFNAVPNMSAYDLNEMIPDYISVRDVVYSPNQAESLLQGFFTDFSFDNRNFFWYHSTYASMTDYYILNAYNEMYLRTIGNEGQWEIIGSKLYLSPVPNKAVLAGIVYNRFPDSLDLRRDEWVREWALTECKMMLGRIRSKYQSVPGPRSDLTLDGSELLSEAREDQDKLRERLNEFVMPALFHTG